MSTKKLSIIIPVYNVEKYIKRCLDSVFDQKVSKSEYEVIVVNDGTQDGSMSIVKQYEKYENLIVLTQENKGLSGARNSGLRIAKGEYVWFVDSDDFLASNLVLKELFAVFDSNKNVEIISSGFYLEDELSGRRLLQQVTKSSSYLGKTLDRNIYIQKAINKGCAPRYIIKRDFFVNNALYFHEGIYHEDFEFVAKLLFFASAVYLVKSPLYVYLIRNSGSITSTLSYKRLFNCLTIVQELSHFKENKASSLMDRMILNSTILYVLVYSLQLIVQYKVDKDQNTRDFLTQSRNFRRKSIKVLCFFPFDIWLSFFGTLTLFSPKLFFLFYSLYEKIKK